MPKVSVIVPVYNTYDYLRKCFDSLVNQTLKDIEIIIVNDGTRDKSEEIIAEYVSKHSNIKSYTKPNGGLGDARNYGLGFATGDYIGFVDSDDYIDITMYEKLYEKAIQENSDIVECDFYWVYSSKKVSDSALYYENKETIPQCIRVMVCNKLFKRDTIVNNNILFPKGLRYEDIEFTYKMIPYTNKISYVEEELYFYVQRGDSISNNQTEKVRDIFSILDNIETYYKDKGIYDQHKELLEYLNVRYLLGSSFLRILGISDSKLRRDILEETWQYLKAKYPRWKKNKHLKSLPGMKNKYYRLMNKPTYKLSSYIFRIIKR